MDWARSLAQFLRARRERLDPAEVGIESTSRRRVPGLRREEVAFRAGVSADYYIRLEQARGHHPSRQVLERLAHALNLDDDATAHLLALGRPGPLSRGLHRQAVSPWLQDLIDSWPMTGAFVHGPRLDILAANSLALAITPVAEPGTNMLRSFFLDTASYERYPDLDRVLTQAVAYFRAHVHHDLDHPAVTSLVSELAERSERFRTFWARHDVQEALAGEDPYNHPTMGLVHLRYQTFAIDGTDQHTLFVVSADPESPAAEALARLSRPSSTPQAGTHGA